MEEALNSERNSIDNEDKEPEHESNSPESPSTILNSGLEPDEFAPPTKTDTLDTLSRSSTSTITHGRLIPDGARKLPVAEGQLLGKSVNSLKTISSGRSFLSSEPEDTIMTKPLLNELSIADNSEHGSNGSRLYGNEANPSTSSLPMRSGSIITNLNFARDPDSSIDISSMMSSAIDRTDNPINPIGFQLSERTGFQGDSLWNHFSLSNNSSSDAISSRSGRKSTNTVSSQSTLHAGKDAERTAEHRKTTGFGVQPLLNTLSENPNAGK